MSQDQGGQKSPQIVPVPDGRAEDVVGGVVVPLGGQTGGLPDAADGVRAETDDPASDQGLERLEDLRVEAIAKRLYHRGERRDKLIHGVGLRAAYDPGVLEHPPG